MNVSARCNVVCCVECECAWKRWVASCGRRKHHVCIIYLHKVGDLRSSKPINCLNADSFPGHESWEGECPGSWSAGEPWGPAAWRGKVRTAGAGGSPRWLCCRSNPLRWDSRSASCLPVGASQRCSRSHLRGAGGPGRAGWALLGKVRLDSLDCARVPDFMESLT